MAVLQMITCDLHNDAGVEGRSVRFSVEGKEFEFDLCDEHLSEFRSVIGPYVAAAHSTDRVATTRPRAAARGRGPADRRADLAEIRTWAKENGWTVAERGRIPATVIAAYDERGTDPSAKKVRKRG